MHLLIILASVLNHHSFSSTQTSLNLSFNKTVQTLSVDYTKFWQINDSKFRIGLGPRLTSQWGNTAQFETAPARLTKGQAGPHSLFLSKKTENIDNFDIDSYQITAVNLAAHIEYQIDTLWNIGFNIDFIGFSFGKKIHGSYTPRSDAASFPSAISAYPTGFNLLLVDDNDRGSLNSELFLKHKINEQFDIKLGLNHAFAEMTTKRALRNNNDRFRYKSTAVTTGVIYNF